MNCVLDNGVRILSRSRGQEVRGRKHRQHRPSLVVADDVEGLDWVRTQENRDKSDRRFRGDVLPSVDEHGRVVIIGNWLHTDGLMARLKNTGLFTVLEFPLLREGDGTEIERCTWKAKYPTQEAIDRKREELGDIGFRRKMLQPNPLNRHTSFHDSMDTFDNIRHSSLMSSEWFVEAVQAAVEEMEPRAFAVTPMRPIKDKRARLRVAARYIKNGTVKFPRHGCEQLLTQVLGFGAEKHDDLIDALVWLMFGVAQDGKRCITFEGQSTRPIRFLCSVRLP
jgi:hypothetical protein